MIKSLTEGEKRDFRRKSAGSGYLKLFDVLDRQKEYDEGKAREGLGGSGYGRYMSYGKNYLYRQLLESLRILHGRAKPYPSPEVAISEYWTDIHVLLDKGLYSQVFKRISHAKKHCMSYHLEHDLLKLIMLERRLIALRKEKGGIKILERLHEECIDIQIHLNMEVQLFQVYERIWINIQNQDSVQVGMATKSAMKFFENNEDYFSRSPSFNNLLYYHFCMAVIFEAENDSAQACRHYGTILEIYDKYPRVKAANIDRYLGVMKNYFNHLLTGLARFSPREFEKFLDRLQALKGKDSKARMLIDRLNMYYPLIYFIQTHDFERALLLDKPIVELLGRQKTKIPEDTILTFQYHLALAYIIAGVNNSEQKKAYLERGLDWLNAIENLPKDDLKSFLKSLSKALQIIVHFELGNETLARSLALRMLGNLRKHKKTNSLEYGLTDTVKRTMATKTADKKRALFELLRERLKTFPGTEFVLIWVEKRLEQYA
ncbi:MAG: hypothetical protein IPJ00_12630 [Saprospirales bacterium]|nr:hypothetical protein [Saprospirales bacterium]